MGHWGATGNGRRTRRTKKAEKQGVGQKRKDGSSYVSYGKVEGGGQTLYGFNRRTGHRNRCYICDGGYHLSPIWPSGYVPKSELG